MHLTLGNHDERDVFYSVMQEEQPETPPVKSKHISVVQTPHANFFLLDFAAQNHGHPGNSGGRSTDLAGESPRCPRR